MVVWQVMIWQVMSRHCLNSVARCMEPHGLPRQREAGNLLINLADVLVEVLHRAAGLRVLRIFIVGTEGNYKNSSSQAMM